MRRTQVHLDGGLSDALDRLARRRGTSRAEVIRDAARRLVAAEEPEDDPIWGIVGMFDSGLGDASVNHDKYLMEIELEKRRRYEESRKRAS